MTPAEQLANAVERGDLAADPTQAEAARLLNDLWHQIQAWNGGRKGLFGRKRTTPRGIYLYGGVGTGKSMLMDLFYETAPVAQKRRVHFHEFLQEVQGRLTAERARKDRDPAPRVAQAIANEVRLLCFDELQVTDVGDAMILGRLFKGLFEAGVVVVATSNREPDALYKDGLNRQLFLPFIEMIKAQLTVFELDSGRDYRLERLERAPVYYTPLGPDADAAMDAMFASLTTGAMVRPCTVGVGGRTLEVPHAAAGVARFTFEALCDRPLGPADYLALTDRFHTVMIDHTPVLSAAKRDQAKRFVTLIDALYDRRTKLVMSAEAEPEALYTEGEYAFEFQRTVSRLMEMRSREYLAAERRNAPPGVQGPDRTGA